MFLNSLTAGKRSFPSWPMSLFVIMCEKLWGHLLSLLLTDVCLKEVPSIADSVYNIRLLKEFSNQYLNQCFYLRPEDLLYSPPVLKVKQHEHSHQTVLVWLECRLASNFSVFHLQQNNVMVFIAELFWWFEVVKPDFVQPRDLQEVRDGTTRPWSSQSVFVSIC